MVNRTHGTESARVNFTSPPASIGVCAATSVRIRQKKVSRSRSVKAVVSWLRKSVVSRSGQGSRRQLSIWKILVRTKTRCRLPEKNVVQTS